MAGGRRWRNHDGGYGVVTKAFHWLIASLITAQFAIGYAWTRAVGEGVAGVAGEVGSRVEAEDGGGVANGTSSVTTRCSPSTSCWA